MPSHVADGLHRTLGTMLVIWAEEAMGDDMMVQVGEVMVETNPHGSRRTVSHPILGSALLVGTVGIGILPLRLHRRGSQVDTINMMHLNINREHLGHIRTDLSDMLRMVGLIGVHPPGLLHHHHHQCLVVMAHHQEFAWISGHHGSNLPPKVRILSNCYCFVHDISWLPYLFCSY